MDVLFIYCKIDLCSKVVNNQCSRIFTKCTFNLISTAENHVCVSTTALMGNVERSLACFSVPCTVETLNGLEFRYFNFGLYVSVWALCKLSDGNMILKGNPWIWSKSSGHFDYYSGDSSAVKDLFKPAAVV